MLQSNDPGHSVLLGLERKSLPKPPIVHHHLNDGDITLVSSLDPRFDLQKNSDTLSVETEASSLQSIPAFCKHLRNLVASRIDVALQDVSILGNFRTVYRDDIRNLKPDLKQAVYNRVKLKEGKLVQVVVEENVGQ